MKTIKNTVLIGLAYSILLNGMLYIGQLVIARTLSREDYALFVVATNFVALTAMFVDLGLTSFFVKLFTQATHESQQDRQSDIGRIFGTVLFMRMLMSVLMVCVVVFLAPQLGYSSEVVSLMIIFTFSFFISPRLIAVRGVGEAYLRGTGRYRSYISYAALDALCFAVATLTIRYYKQDVYTLMAIYTFCNLPGFILVTRAIIKDFKRLHIRLQIDFTILKMVLTKGAPLILGFVFLTIHNAADPLLLDKLSTPFEVSAFGASLRVQNAMLFLPSVFSWVIGPEITRYLVAKDIGSAHQLVHKGMRILLVLSAAIAFVVTALPNVTIALLFGEGIYTDIAPLIVLLAWAFVGIAYSSYMIEIAVAEGKEWISIVYMSASVIVSLALDFALIPTLGAYGAAIARFASILIATITVMQVTRSMTSIQQNQQRLFMVRFIISVGCGFIIYEIAKWGGVHELVNGALTLSGYLLAAIFLGIIERRDFTFLMPKIKSVPEV